MVVVLPAPLGPRSPTISPSAIEKDMFSTAVKLPNFLVKFCTISMSLFISKIFCTSLH